MARTKRLRKQTEEVNHWLEEGISGQDSLLADLDPYMYISDALISKTFSHIAYYYSGLYSGNRNRPLSLIFAPDDSIPWQIPFLRSRSEVAIYTSEFDPLLDEAASSFDATLFTGGIPEQLIGDVDFLLFAGSRWESLTSIVSAVDTAYTMLNEGGGVALVFRALEEPDADVDSLTYRIEFENGDSIEFESVLASIRAGRFARSEKIVTRFDHLLQERDYGVGDFAKRHKNFFGEGARSLCLSRLYEDEFQALIHTKNRCALTLILSDPGN